MTILKLALGLLLAVALVPGACRADVGWSEERYTSAYGAGKRGFGKANERAYRVGESHLVVEFNADDTASVGELWVLNANREGLPDAVRQAAAAAEKGALVEQVTFKARSAVPAEIREAVLDGMVVRVDTRNQMVYRVAFCGPKPSCSLWRRIFGPACETTPACPVLERALGVDRTMDDVHERAERALERQF